MNTCLVVKMKLKFCWAMPFVRKTGSLLCKNETTMPLLHDLQCRSRIETRLRSLRSDSKPMWGIMSVDQMLWHVNQGLALALGQIEQPAQKTPLPRSVMKFLVLKVPWPKGAPTIPILEAKEQYDFEAQRTRCLGLLKTFTRKALAEEWPLSPIFGEVTGQFTSQLQAKHLDHHLRQFGV